MFNIDSWANPEFLYLLIAIPLLVVWYWFRQNSRDAELQYSDLSVLDDVPKSPRVWLRHSMFVLRLIVLSLLIIAIARPQSTSRRENVSVEGIDIVLAMDVSGSMLARDFKPDRLEASKDIARNFIMKRPNDRIGLVIFSGEAFTQVPLTTDHAMIADMFKDVKSGMIEDGTAIGDGLATAVSRLQESDAISKVVILLTDGVNNSGSVDPMSAAEIAKLYGVRVYTIGIGSEGYAPYPVQTPFGTRMQQMKVQIDEGLLQKIANETGGRYFRATGNSKLRNIFKEIDKLEKSKIDIQEFRKKHEMFLPFALIALGLLVLEVLLRFVVFKKLT